MYLHAVEVVVKSGTGVAHDHAAWNVSGIVARTANGTRIETKVVRDSGTKIVTEISLAIMTIAVAVAAVENERKTMPETDTEG